MYLAISECLDSASVRPPQDYETHQGWVLVALGNTFWQLLHAPSLEEGVSDTVMRAGDTDTNAAIAGALLEAVHGVNAIPAQWREAILSRRPEEGRPGVRRPRPKPFWPVDALALAEALGTAGEAVARGVHG